MKKLYNLWLIACLVCLLSGCAAGQPDSTEGPSRGPTWQEQYDLGVRYLSEGNYEEAILTFTAAIEIDPKRAPAYVGRGNAYVKSGETESNLAAALVDYKRAIELDETSAEAYLGLANVYIRQGDYEKAREILAKGVDKTGSEALQEMLGGIFVEETDANGFNAYGAKAFTLREEYIPFVELSEGGQEFISQATTATIQNDQDTLLSLSETVTSALPIQLEGSNSILYTVWNQYKIRVDLYPIHLSAGSNGTYLNYGWKIEIRPQDGIGYYADVVNANGMEESIDSDKLYWDYCNSTEIASCPCIGWQWNGPYNAQSLRSALQRFDGILRKMQSTTSVTGQMKDSLLDGSFTVIEEYFEEYPNGEHENTYREHRCTEYYDKGEYIGYSGDDEPSVAKFKGFMYSIGGSQGTDYYLFKNYYW